MSRVISGSVCAAGPTTRAGNADNQAEESDERQRHDQWEGDHQVPRVRGLRVATVGAAALRSSRSFGSIKSALWRTGFVPHQQCALNERLLQSPVGGRHGPQNGGPALSLFAHASAAATNPGSRTPHQTTARAGPTATTAQIPPLRPRRASDSCPRLPTQSRSGRNSRST